jgi:hypothetical protein
MTPDHLRQLGELIYGNEWKSAMAADLGVAYRTVLRWYAGVFKIPDGVKDDLTAIAKRRVRELIERAAKLKAIVG